MRSLKVLEGIPVYLCHKERGVFARLRDRLKRSVQVWWGITDVHNLQLSCCPAVGPRKGSLLLMEHSRRQNFAAVAP